MIRSLSRLLMLVGVVPLAWTSVSAAPADEPIVVAMSYSSGVHVDGRGYGAISGAKAFFGRINAAGGVRGRRIAIESFDDHGDPQRYAQELRRLIKDKGVSAILGCIGDVMCAAAATIASDSRIPLIAPLSGADGLARSMNPYVFRVRADYRHELAAIGAQLSRLGCARVAVLSESSEAALEPLTVALLQKQGLAVSVIRVGQGSSGLVESLRSLSIGRYQAVLTNLSPSTIARFVDAGLSEREEWPSTIVTTANGDLGLLRGSFKGRVVGFTQVVPNGELLANPLARELDHDGESYSDSLSVTPEGMEGYIGARLFADALRLSRGVQTGEILRSALAGIENFSLNGFHVGFTKGRESGSDWIEIGVRARSGILVN